MGDSTRYGIIHNMKHNRIIPALTLIGILAIILMLTLTSPTDIGPFGVLLFFTTLYATLFGTFSMLLQLFYKIAFRRTAMRSKDYLYAVVLAFGPIMVLMARSFGAINLWTMGLIIVFLFLAEFLVAKRA